MQLSITLWLRDDISTKFGGDLVLARNLVAASVRYEDLDVRIAASLGEIGSPALLHFYNIDRPFDIVAALRHTNNTIPYIVTATHHRRTWVDGYDRRHRKGLHRAALACRLPSNMIEALKHLWRGRQTHRSARASLRDVSGYFRIGGSSGILRAAQSIVVTSKAEIDWIREDFDIAPSPEQFVEIRNFMGLAALSSQGQQEEHRSIDVVVLGRIESRKNQLTIVDALAGTPYSVVFAGAIGSDSYSRAFLTRLSEAKNVSFLGSLNRDEAFALLKTSRVSLSMSGYEVSSLSDIEAATAGCFVIASEHGSSLELLGEERCRVVDPLASAKEVRQLLEAVLEIPMRSLPPYDFPSDADLMKRIRNQYKAAVSEAYDS